MLARLVVSAVFVSLASSSLACGSPVAKCKTLCQQAGGANATCEHCNDEACAKAIASGASDAPSGGALGIDGKDLEGLAYMAAYTKATLDGVCK